MPETPKDWAEFMQGIDWTEKSKLMEALRVAANATLGSRAESLLKNLGEFRRLPETIGQEGLKKREAFIALAFRK